MKYSIFERDKMEESNVSALLYLFCIICGYVGATTEATMNISPHIVVLSSTIPKSTEFVCTLSSTTGINDVFVMQISRNITNKNKFVALAKLSVAAPNSPYFVSDAPDDITHRGIVSGNINVHTPTLSSLILSFNTKDIVCTDYGQYQCTVTFQDVFSDVGTHKSVQTLQLYGLPGDNIRMVVKKKDQTILGTISNRADVSVGETLVFECTATIGSEITTTIRWRRTSVAGNVDKFIPYYPLDGDYDDGHPSATKQDCSFTRTATISYTVTTFDAKRENNLALQCYVSVVPPNRQGTYETNDPPTFYINPLPQLLMTVSPGIVILASSSPSTITFSCSIASSAGIAEVLFMIISRRRDIDYDFIDIAEVKSTTPSNPSLAQTAPADIAQRAMLFGGINYGHPTQSSLALRMNTRDIVCTDKGQYRCFMIFKDGKKNIETMSHSQHMSIYALPGKANLTALLNGENLQGTIDAKGDVNVGNTLEFTCTADIGSENITKIKWKQTTLIGSKDTFTSYIPPPGSIDDGQASSTTHGCSFTRTAKLRYTVTKFDANRDNNLAFQCYAMVVTEQGTSETNYPPTFYINAILDDNTTITTESAKQEAISSSASFIVQPIFGLLAVVIITIG